jgi:hypothetical protein
VIGHGRLKLRNISGNWAMVHGLPEHHNNHMLIQDLCAQMDAQRQ